MCFPEDNISSESEIDLISTRIKKPKKELNYDEIIKEILPYYMISYFKNENPSDLEIEIMRDTISNDNDYELHLICWANEPLLKDNNYSVEVFLDLLSMA